MSNNNGSVVVEPIIIETVTIQVTEIQGPRGATGQQGPPGDQANIPPNISYFNNDIGYITADSVDTLQHKTWNGNKIDDAYIASADIWNAKQSALTYIPEDSANKNINNGYAGLDGTGKIPSILLPSYLDDVLEFPNVASFPAVGEAGKIYIALDTNFQYRWGGSVYIMLPHSPGSTDEVPEGSVHLYYTDSRVLAFITGKNISLFNNNVGYLTLGSLPPYPTVPSNISAFVNDVPYLTYPNLITTNLAKSSIGVNLDNSGAVLSTGQKGYVYIPFNATIVSWSIVADQSGSAVFDVWKSNVYPTVANSITGSAKPTLSSSNKANSSTLTGWTTTINAGDIIGWNLDSVSTITRAILQLLVIKT